MSQSLIAALVHERESLVKRGLVDRVAQVDAELRRLGVDAKPPAQRAERRVPKSEKR